MSKIRMEHPDLPGQPIWVFPQAAPVHAFSGWVEAPEPPPEPSTSPAQGEESASHATEPPTGRSDEMAARFQPARRRVVEPTTSIEE